MCVDTCIGMCVDLIRGGSVMEAGCCGAEKLMETQAKEGALDFAPGRRAWPERARAALTTPRTSGILVGTAFASFVVFEVVHALLGDSPTTTAARIVVSICLGLMDTSLWLSLDLYILLQLRARYLDMQDDCLCSVFLLFAGCCTSLALRGCKRHCMWQCVVARQSLFRLCYWPSRQLLLGRLFHWSMACQSA